MKFNDLGLGFLLLALSVAFWFGVQNMPNPTGQPFGPSAFPHFLTVLLGFCAILLMVSGARATERGPLFTLADWTRDPKRVGKFLLLPVVVVAYVGLVERVGFLPVAAGILSVMLLVGGVGLRRSLVIAVVAAFVIHSIFYLALGVQLPWGLLEPIRW